MSVYYENLEIQVEEHSGGFQVTCPKEPSLNRLLSTMEIATKYVEKIRKGPTRTVVSVERVTGPHRFIDWAATLDDGGHIQGWNAPPRVGQTLRVI